MFGAHLVPAGLIGLLAVLPPVVARVLPMGEATVLVRTGTEPGSAAVLASRSNALLLGVPVRGYALLSGDAGHIRAIAGLTVRWDQTALCVSR